MARTSRARTRANDGGGYVAVDDAFIQVFTFGKSASAYAALWIGV
jgi:hypothetical protein